MFPPLVFSSVRFFFKSLFVLGWFSDESANAGFSVRVNSFKLLMGKLSEFSRLCYVVDHLLYFVGGGLEGIKFEFKWKFSRRLFFDAALLSSCY